MKSFLILIFLFITSSGNCQKETSRILDASGIHSIVFRSDEVFNIVISTTPGKTIKISSVSGGEYSGDIGIVSRTEKGTLFLRSRFREGLHGGYDKLSAHKVFSMEVELIVPEGLTVEILSDLASVYARGAYKELVIGLKSGSGNLMDFTGNAVVNTYGGDIVIETENARVEAVTRNGRTDIAQSIQGDHLLRLTSIDGDIKVEKSDKL